MKLTDWGYASWCPDGAKLSRLLGTAFYIAPEATAKSTDSGHEVRGIRRISIRQSSSIFETFTVVRRNRSSFVFSCLRLHFIVQK